MHRQVASIEEFHTLVRDGYYLAEAYNICSVRDVHYNLESAVAGIIPISRYQGTSVGVRRSWHHIRKQPSGLYVIWYPLSGSVVITQGTHHNSVATPDEFIITCADQPFHARSATPDGRNSMMMHVLVPSHVIRTLIPQIDRICGKVFDTKTGTARIARGMFTALLEESSKIDGDTASRLAMSALEMATETLTAASGAELVHVDAKKENLARVLRFIDQHLSTQGLSANDVANACKISRRYLHYLLSDSDTTFGAYLWERRLSQAKEWLTHPEFRHFNIVDIAYMCGFRSGSHFSNAYRSQYGHSPTEERAQHEA